MEKRAAHEKEKYQPSYDTTVLTEVMRRPRSEERPSGAPGRHLEDEFRLRRGREARVVSGHNVLGEICGEITRFKLGEFK